MSIVTYFAKILRLFLALIVIGCVAAAGGAAYVWFYVVPQLPDTESLKDMHLQVPLRVYSKDGAAIAEFGEQRRRPLNIKAFSPHMVQAVLAAEDDRFYEHPGIDSKGIMRAAINLLRTGRKEQGASTITMQVARNFFLSGEKTFKRKLKEMLLALRIENELEKDEILELYMNKIFLGYRAYGFGAAALTYYNVDIQDLTLAQCAMLAGLPKAPSTNNPVINPPRALERRNYILQRMLSLGYIDEAAYQEAVAEVDKARVYAVEVELDASYVAEMVRDYMLEHYGEEAYTAGFRVYTTLPGELQNAAKYSLQKALQTYDKRHDYRGVSGHVDLAATPATEQAEEIRAYWDKLLKDTPTYTDLLPAIVMEVHDKSAVVYASREGLVTLEWEGLSWARRYIDDRKRGPVPKNASEIFQPGDIVYIYPRQYDLEESANAGQAEAINWRLAQIPQAQAAFIALDPNNGAILALQGGYDFYHSKFNRIVQAQRQPGSNFKPFVYSAALELGKTVASQINDAPVVFQSGNKIWRPENYGEKSYGPTSLRKALTESRNLVSIRLLYELGMTPVLRHIARFGFDTSRLPHDLTLALGTCNVTPLELARGFSVFANGGHLIEPYFIERIEAYNGEVIYQARPKTVCQSCNLPVQDGMLPALAAGDPATSPDTAAATGVPAMLDAVLGEDTANYAPRVIPAQNAWLMTSIMQDVIKEGTGKRALALGRSDIAGKTGTTNDQRDAWFSGFNAEIVASAWVGFDQPRPLGRLETGGRAALPIWLEFMRTALKDHPHNELPMPAGLVQVRIDPASGLRAPPDWPNAVFEVFRSDNVPARYANALPSLNGNSQSSVNGTPDIF